MLIGTVKETYDLMKYDRQAPEAIIVGIAYEQTFEDWYRLRTRDFTRSTDETAAMFPRDSENFLLMKYFPLFAKTIKYRIMTEL